MEQKTLMLVDFKQGALESLLSELDALDHEIVIAKSQEEALKKMQQFDIHCILMDVDLRMTGIKFAEKARGNGYGKPIIFVTNEGSAELEYEAMKVGAFDFLNRPYDADDLIYILEDALYESSDMANAV